jgi:hypothetical protein
MREGNSYANRWSRFAFPPQYLRALAPVRVHSPIRVPYVCACMCVCVCVCVCAPVFACISVGTCACGRACVRESVLVAFTHTHTHTHHLDGTERASEEGGLVGRFTPLWVLDCQPIHTTTWVYGLRFRHPSPGPRLPTDTYHNFRV